MMKCKVLIIGCCLFALGYGNASAEHTTGAYSACENNAEKSDLDLPHGFLGYGTAKQNAIDAQWQQNASENLLKCKDDPQSDRSDDALAAAEGYSFAALDYYVLGNETKMLEMARLGRRINMRSAPHTPDQRREYAENEHTFSCVLARNCNFPKGIYFGSQRGHD